ncbi:MAG TPA: polysaccharide deacetylase family protein [Solirubrobacteraceae bacterium]
MRSPRRLVARPLTLVATVVVIVALSGCGSDEPAPNVLPLSVQLTAHERAVWQPLPASRAGIPVLLYHGIGERSDFDSAADAAYGVTQPNFAKQMALLRAAGYQTITLEQFRAYIAGEHVDLPPHPLLLTFDDSLDNSFKGADAVLRQLRWTAVMFVDAGSVEARRPRYASWDEIAAAQRSGRWEMQLHAGRGHHNIVYDAAGTTGPFYANRVLHREDIGAWQRRVLADLNWGAERLDEHVPGYRALSFAPPYGNYGQLATDDRQIPIRLDRWLRKRFGLVFVQEPAHYARPGETVVPRLQITRKMSGGDIHAWLATHAS